MHALDYLPLWLLVPAFALFLGSAVEIGYRFGLWRRTHAPGESEQPVGAVVASILGLLALVLGFTFGFAASRFDSRRITVLEEANAIGTTFLRTEFLPPEDQQASREKLREYVKLRIMGSGSSNPLGEIAQSETLQMELWSHAVKVGKDQPTSEMVSLYVDSLNNLIDLHSTRVLVGIRSRIPFVMWLGLLAMSFLSMVAVGYQSGHAATRRSPVLVVMIVCFTLVLGLIADLDRGQEGFLQISQQALVDVQQMMNVPSATSAAPP